MPPISQNRTLSEEEKRVGKNRADFMRRFFSVAVSVGFASKLRDFRFLSSLQDKELRQFILLVFAMIIVVGSWDFYFRSIDENEKPLKDVARFAIDILIVSIYIMLLLSVTSFANFLFYTDIIMMLYVVWDVLTIGAYQDHFGISEVNFGSIVKIYIDGFRLKGKTGPFITLWWLLMFLLVTAFHLLVHTDFYGIAVATAIAYLMYRMDQGSPWTPRSRLVFSAAFLVALAAFLGVERAI
jgi:hypothetical protein